ncbi:MAG: hypothetical protein ABMB14_41090, partial [Myxococcota bacterium]
CGGGANGGDVEALIRASMALRGVRPSIDEVEAVAGGAPLEPIARRWLSEPTFGATIRDLHAEQLLVRFDVRNHVKSVGPLRGVPEGDLVRRLDEEPLAFVEQVVAQGRPYTEIVTADTTMADRTVAAAYGLPYDDAGPEWQELPWSDGRPAAGILSSSTVWQRFMSSTTNHHRSRANLVRSILLCDPFVGGSVVSDPTALDALADDPACGACHSELDPLSSAFFGFRDYVLPGDNVAATQAGCPPELAWACYPLKMWDPAGTVSRDDANMPPAALGDVPLDDVGDLGLAIAADPRFATCTARRFAGYLTQRPIEDVPDDEADRLADLLIDAGWDARELALAVVLDPAFLDGGPQQARPEQVARTFEALTGWRWEVEPEPGYGEVDLALTDRYGYRSILGGLDGWNTIRPVHQPTATRELTLA